MWYMYTACVNVCVKVNMSLNTRRPGEKDGYPILSLSSIFLWVRISPWTSCPYSHVLRDAGAYANASDTLPGFCGSKLGSWCLYNKCSCPGSISPALEPELSISWCLCNKHYERTYWSVQNLWNPPAMGSERQDLINLRWWESLVLRNINT